MNSCYCACLKAAGFSVDAAVGVRPDQVNRIWDFDSEQSVALGRRTASEGCRSLRDCSAR